MIGVILAAVVVTVSHSASATNLLMNPGFEIVSGYPVAQWNASYWLNQSYYDGTTRYDGSYAAFANTSGSSTDNYLEQDINTVKGATYDVSFYYDLGAGGYPSFPRGLNVYFGGKLLAYLNYPQVAQWNSFDDSTVVASGDQTLLSFVAINPGGASPSLAIDDVSVTEVLPPPISAVPLPAGLTMFGSALFALLAIAATKRGQYF